MIKAFRQRRPLALLLPLLIVAVVVPVLIGHCGMSEASARPLGRRGWPPPSSPSLAGAPALPRPPTISLNDLQVVDNRVFAPTADGRQLELTLDPRLQRYVQDLFRRKSVAYGAAVFMSIPDGKILAMTGYSRAEPSRTQADLTLSPWAPAASVFKIVTSAALVDHSGVSPERKVCYHGGTSRLQRHNLEDRPRLDRRCVTLSQALGRSTNSVIAKLAHRHLDPPSLMDYAGAFGFNARRAPSEAFPLEVPASPAEVPGDELEFARTAAGFWHVFLSPLHGARIASAIANDGLMVSPRLVERIHDTDGHAAEPSRQPPERVIPAQVAAQVAEMMVGTTRFGTARRAFTRRGRRLLPFDVAGKTGTLSRKKPYTHYNWFVGFAPAESPEVAFGVIVGTDGLRIKAAEVAQTVLRQIRRRRGHQLLASR